MGHRTRPALGSVTIRRLVLASAESRLGLEDAIAAAVAHEFGAPASGEPRHSGVAEVVARGIADRLELAPIASGSGRNSNGRR